MPDRGDEAVELSADHLSFLQKETDHFFNGEMAHEQRASWILALASGLLIGLWRLLTSDFGLNLTGVAFFLWMTTLLVLVVAVALSLWALWPLGGGKKPGVLRPWRPRPAADAKPTTGDLLSLPGEVPPIPERFQQSISMLVWHHYVFHRRRAEVKGRRVVRATMSLFTALFIGTAGILAAFI